jgi:hypothetical protein
MKALLVRMAAILAIGLLGWIAGPSHRAEAQESPARSRLHDRGTGIPASIFGTYIRRGQLLVYPFFEYSRDHNVEYNPAKLGYGLNREFRGKFASSAAQIFFGYGLSDRLAVELEAAHVNATLEKSPLDASTLPDRLRQSGVTDVEGQLRLRLMEENDRRPEVFAFAEITAPTQTDKRLIGDVEWDFKPGIGAVRGYSWGTVTARGTVEYTRDDKSLNVGEVALEYLKLLTPSVRLFLGVEGGEGGAPDEWSLNSGVQWRLTDVVCVKLDNALALSSKATDWAPVVGLLLAVPE